MKPKMARKPRPTDEVSSPPLSPTSGRLMHKKRRLESKSVSPDRKMSTTSIGDKGLKKQSPKFSPPKSPIVKEHKVPKPLSPLPPLLVDDQFPCSSNAPVTTVQPPPEFLAFNYNLDCPAIRQANKADEPLLHIKSEMLRDIQHELEAMLAHTMDFMKRASGDLQFLDTGEYPIVNLKKREMPVFQMRVLASPLSPTTQVHHEISLRSLLVPSIAPDDDIDVWPPPHLGTRYQSWLMMERKERMIDNEALDQFEKFITSEINELDLEYVDVRVPEFRHRLHFTSSLDMFSSFERRLHDHSLQLQQKQMGEKGLRVIHNNCARSSMWWTHPLSSFGAAEAFSKNRRANYDSIVTERRVKMMRINLLPSLHHQSYEDKKASKREEALKKENKELKIQLKEAKKSMEREGKRAEKEEETKKQMEEEHKSSTEMKKVPSTPWNSAKKKLEVEMPSSSKGTQSLKSTTLAAVISSTSSDVTKPMTSSTGGARFVMVMEDERGRRRVMPLGENGEWRGKEERREKERRVTLKGGDLPSSLHITIPPIDNRFEKRLAGLARRSRIRRVASCSRSRAHESIRVRAIAVAAGRARSAPPPPREKWTRERMIRGAEKVMERFGMKRCTSVRELSVDEAKGRTRGIIVRKTHSHPRKFSPIKRETLSPRKISPVKKSPQKQALYTPQSPQEHLTQMQRLQQRHAHAAAAAAKRPPKTPQKDAATSGTKPSVTPSSKVAVAPKTPSSVPSPPTKPAPSLPKSPIPSPTTTSVSTRTPSRRQKTPEEAVTPSPKTTPSRRRDEKTPSPSPLQSNGVENGAEQSPTPARRSTRDRKPSLKFQQSQSTIDQFLTPHNSSGSTTSSRKSSRVPGPTPTPDREDLTDHSSVPNGFSPTKEEMPLLSPMAIKPSTRRQTRNSMDAAAPPPVLQVQQVLLLQEQAQQLQLPPPILSPIKTSPVSTRSRRGIVSSPKDTPLLLTSPKEEITVATPYTVASPKSPVDTPKKIPNGLASPVTRRRASLEEKKEEEKEVKEEEPETKTISPKNEKNTKKKVKKGAVKKQSKSVCLCLRKLEEFKKSGKEVCMKQLEKWIIKKGMVVKMRFTPRSMMGKRERRVEILEKCLQRAITNSPTRYMLSEEEKKKMEAKMGKKANKTVCLKQKKRQARVRRSEIRRDQRTRRWVSSIWYNLKQAERIARREMREEKMRVTVMVERIDGKSEVKIIAIKNRAGRGRKREVKRVDGWKKILKKDGKKTKKVEMKSPNREKSTTRKSVTNASKSSAKRMEMERKEEKKDKKVKEPSIVLFKGRMPKLIEGEEQWKEFIRVEGKPLTESVVEGGKTEKKESMKSPVKNGQRQLTASLKKSGKTKKVEEEVKEVVITIGKIKDQKEQKEGKTRKISTGKTPNGQRMVRKVKKDPKKIKSKREKSIKKKDVKLSTEHIRNKYLISSEERVAVATEKKRMRTRRQLVKIIRKALTNAVARNGQMKILRALAKNRRKMEHQDAHSLPSIDMTVPGLNEKRSAVGWPTEWIVPKHLRAPGVYRRRKLRAVRRAESKREKQRIEKEVKERTRARAAGVKLLRSMPWTKRRKGKREKREVPEGKINVLESITKACVMKENGTTAKAIAEIKWTAREKVMDVVFDTVFCGGKIQHRDKSKEEEMKKALRKQRKMEKKKEKEERTRKGSIRGEKDLIKEENHSDEEKEEEDDEMNQTLELGEESNGDYVMGSPVKKPLTALCKNEVAIELAVAQREYQREVDNYSRMLMDIFYMMGAREQQTRARRNLELKEDVLAQLHANCYREVPRRLPNEQEMQKIAKALSDRREAMEQAFGANLWRQPRIQNSHPAWLTAEYRSGSKRQDKYNYFVDWDYAQKREITRAHEKMWAAATSHHLAAGEAYGKYGVGVEREMEGEEKTLFEWEKNLIGGLIVSRRKQQQRLVNPLATRFRSLPKRPPTAASMKKRAEMEKKRKEEKEREEKEEETERRKEAQRDIYAFDSDEDEKPNGRDEWEEKEEAARKWSMEEREEKKPTPPCSSHLVIPSTEKRKALQQKWQRWTRIGETGERTARIKVDPEDFADEDDEEDEEEEYSSLTSLGMGHAASVTSSMTGTLSVKGEEGEEGGEVKVKKVKKQKMVRYDSDGEKKVDRRKVGGLDLPSSISHLDPMIFLKLIPDNRSHKKGQGKKAMLKQIMIDYAAKESKGAGPGARSPAIPSRPQCTQQQLMSPGGSALVAGGGEGSGARSRRALVSPQGSEQSERREKKEEKIDKKIKKRKEPVEEVEEMMPIRRKGESRESRGRLVSPLSPPKAYGGRRNCTRKAKSDDEEEDDDINMKVPYTPASLRGKEIITPPHSSTPAASAASAATRSPSVQSSALSPLSGRSCRRKGNVKYNEDDDPVISSRSANRKVTKKATVKQETPDEEYPL
ncbi:hypothetical protein PENTCL1PPCAC_18360 [Pristionchus entomophagus]|uniref:Uncharacterized protein n=1 Tax=Pristionchus entomophagus TaxID=358040 RepID=A0AAV5TP33_9BILA|nr:hypothetical protein PENTCL1PPCAC_18360 [Pristionchus entomophagus]